MSGVLGRIEGLSPQERDLCEGLLSDLAQRRPRNLLRSNLYDGRHAVSQLGDVIPPQYYRTATVLGWPAKAVDLLARRCNLDGVSVEGDDTAIDDLLDQNRLYSELDQALVSSLLHSPAFAVVSRGGDDEPAGLVHFYDALSATGQWDPRRRRLASALVVHEWRKADFAAGLVEPTPARFTLFLDGLTVSCEWVEPARGGGGSWSVQRRVHRFGMLVEPLVYRPRLSRPFGSSRVTRPVISAYESAVRTAIRMEATADAFSLPQLMVMGAERDQFRSSDGAPLPDWKIALGRMLVLPDNDSADNPRVDVKRFEGSSPEPHLAMLRQQAELFAGETSIPITSLGVTSDGNPTSAESYMASREDLVAEAEGAMRDWRAPLTRVLSLAAGMADGATSSESLPSVDLHWRSPMYVSRAAAADAGQKQLAAVPALAETTVGLELLGLTADQIRRVRAELDVAASRKLVSDLVAAASAPAPAPASAAAPAETTVAPDAVV